MSVLKRGIRELVSGRRISMFSRAINGLILFFMLVFSGCVAAPQPAPILVWPGAPDPPRIAYLGSHRSAGDFRRQQFLDAVLGAPPVKGLVRPYGVAAQGDRIYVADSNGAALAVFDDKAETLTYFGAVGKGKLVMPIGVAAAADGTVYVSDAKSKRVTAYDASGEMKFYIGDQGTFQNPTGMAVNEALDRLYVCLLYTSPSPRD